MFPIGAPASAKQSAPCHGVKNSWYLSLLTVAPEKQGQGIGSKLLHERLIPHILSKGGEQFSLFTNSENNRVFYSKNGFKEFHQQVFTDRGNTLGSWSFMMNLQDGSITASHLKVCYENAASEETAK